MEQNKNLNSGTIALLTGEIINALLLLGLVGFLSFNAWTDGYAAIPFIIPLYVLIFLFFIFAVRGIFFSFKKTKLFKMNNLPIPKSLMILKIISIIFLLAAIIFILSFSLQLLSK